MKVRRISDFQSRISFPSLDNHLQAHRASFIASDLGKIYQAIPWRGFVEKLNLHKFKKGPESIFTPRGKVALMFLKHYTCTSDKKLIDQFNGNLHYQIFCDTILEPGQRLTNFKIVSQIRCEIAEKLKISDLEEVFFEHWRSYMTNLESITCDATCYESSISYPTDQKLLFQSMLWLHKQVYSECKRQKCRQPRTKFKKWVARAISYSKMRRKTKKKRRSLTRALLKLVAKLDYELTQLEKTSTRKFTKQYEERRTAIKLILEQQHHKFHEGQRPKGALVSIDKPYIRPIVRGKEVKPVEFGAKVNKLQIDGISFVEHLSFNAFNEGVRLLSTIYRAQKLTRVKVKLVGADAIYATNANRKKLTQKKIQTDFKAKGRKGKHSKQKAQLKKMITKERASRLEGSFGTDKEHFLLKRIKARTQKTEVLWIFFGIHTSNALKIGKRMSQKLARAA